MNAIFSSRPATPSTDLDRPVQGSHQSTMARIQDLLENGFPLMSFPNDLEESFQRDALPARERHFLISGLISLLVYNGYLLADLCAPLIVAHRTLAAAPEALLARIALLAPRSPAAAEAAYATAAQWMRHHCQELRAARGALVPDPSLAARFFLLLGSNFNGLWRVNARGEYNVPIGRRGGGAPILYQISAALDGLTMQSAALRQPGVSLLCADMLATIAEAGDGDVVYADPPYCGTHSAYTAGKFPLVLHAELARVVATADDQAKRSMRTVWMVALALLALGLAGRERARVARSVPRLRIHLRSRRLRR